MKRLSLVPAVLAVLALLAAGCASAGGPGAASAATVNGSDIAMSSLFDDLEVLADNSSYTASLQQQGIEVFGSDGTTYGTAFVATWLTTLIQNELVAQQLESLGGSANADEQQQAQQTYAQIEGTVPQEFLDRLVQASADQLALQRVLEENAPAATVTDEQVRAYYDANIDSLMQQAGGEVVCATQITAAFDATGQTATPTPEQQATAQQAIDQVAARVQAGEDFVTVANEIGQGSGGGVSGGNAGCFPRGSGQVPEAFEEAAFTQPIGEVGEPIQSEVGYSLLLVRSRGVFPFEEASAAIRQQLEGEKGDVVQQEAGRFLTESSIEIDQRFGTFDKEQASVVPPEGPISSTSEPPLDELLTGDPTDPAGTGTP